MGDNSHLNSDFSCLFPRLDVTVVDVGPPADWVKINVQRTVKSQLLLS